jgi:hypothetical protein
VTCGQRTWRTGQRHYCLREDPHSSGDVGVPADGSHVLGQPLDGGSQPAEVGSAAYAAATAAAGLADGTPVRTTVMISNMRQVGPRSGLTWRAPDFAAVTRRQARFHDDNGAARLASGNQADRGDHPVDGPPVSSRRAACGVRFCASRSGSKGIRSG